MISIYTYSHIAHVAPLLGQPLLHIHLPNFNTAEHKFAICSYTSIQSQNQYSYAKNQWAPVPGIMAQSFTRKYQNTYKNICCPRSTP
jgi:hypothetical protein